MLPYGSKAMVEKHISDLTDLFASIHWTRLAKYHPEIVQETIYAWADRSYEEDPHLLLIASQVIKAMGEIPGNRRSSEIR
jgi:hypothetical protein